MLVSSLPSPTSPPPLGIVVVSLLASCTFVCGFRFLASCTFIFDIDLLCVVMQRFISEYLVEVILGVVWMLVSEELPICKELVFFGVVLSIVLVFVLVRILISEYLVKVL